MEARKESCVFVLSVFELQQLCFYIFIVFLQQDHLPLFSLFNFGYITAKL